MSDNCIDASTQEGSVILNDLQSILSKSLDNKVKVLKLTTSDLLPKGENYGSTILKVEAFIKRNTESPEEKLSLVAKMVPTSEYQKTHFNITNSFNKEIYAFEKLIPAYKEIERNSGVKDEDLFDILPKYYGGRLNRNKKLLNEADEDAVLLMENLKARHFYTMNRMRGLDFYHAKEAISKLARFHALGRALKCKSPAFFEEATKVMDIFPIEMSDSDFKEIATHLYNSICADPRIAKYKEKLRPITSAGWDSILPSQVFEPWITFIHGDFWVNNIMFKKDNGKITDVKFIDFQLMKVSSPLRDLPYFLCGSVDSDTIEMHFDELLEIYYDKFIEALDSTDCDVSPFTRKSFYDNLKAEAQNELFHCLVAVKFFYFEVANDFDLNDMKGSIMLSDPSPLFLDRAHLIITKFIEKGWI